MFQDFKELLSSFNVHSVKYLVVGGYAVSFHAQPRFTKDLDVFIKADAANAKAAFDALAAFGGITVDDLANPGKFSQFGKGPSCKKRLSGDAQYDLRAYQLLSITTGGRFALPFISATCRNPKPLTVVRRILC
jgi:hypothetical protein